MPNWVFNTLTIEGDEKLIADIKARLAQPYETHFPDRKFDQEKQEWVSTPATQKHEKVISFWNIIAPTDLDAYYADKVYTPNSRTNKEIFADIEEGFREGMDWYNWNVRNWGSKWDASSPYLSEDTPTKIVYRFDTAWSPPENAIGSLSEIYPTAEISLHFEEEQGWGGVIEYLGGVPTVTQSWDIPESHQDYLDRDQECWACNGVYKHNGEWVGVEGMFSDCPRDFLEEGK